MLGYNAGKCRWYEDKCLHTGNKNERDDHEEEIMKPYAEMTKEELIALRKELKARNISHLKVCWSPEPPLTPGPAEEDTGNRRATPGSISFVPPVAGLLIAGQIVRDICGLD